jgi:TRAP-type C4-dicarboxylate transport system permease small subunit
VSETVSTSVHLEGEFPGWRRGVRTGENVLITLCLATMVVLPLLEMALRSTTIVLPGSSAVQSHLTLFVCMIGGAIAARDGRLLSLSTVTAFLKSRAKTAARFFSGAVAASFTAILFVASLRFVLQEREAGNILAYGPAELPLSCWLGQFWLRRPGCRLHRQN